MTHVRHFIFGGAMPTLRLRMALAVIVVLVPLVLAGAASADDRRESTVGMPARIDQLVLPGTELEVKPLDDRKLPIVLRIVEVYPHGTDFRYDLVFYGLDPGTFDLRDYLRRKDGSSTAHLPPLPVTIRPLLPAGQIEPHPLQISETPWLGGYRVMLTTVGVLWVAVLAVILFARRRGHADNRQELAKPLTLAQRLRPLVEKAVAGKLSHAQCAELERSLLAYWRTRLKLETMNPAEAIQRLRKDAQAGPLLEQMELWLHRPGPSASVDVARLLEPYQNLPPDALEAAKP
jgi:hypothetical protein